MCKMSSFTCIHPEAQLTVKDLIAHIFPRFWVTVLHPIFPSAFSQRSGLKCKVLLCAQRHIN